MDDRQKIEVVLDTFERYLDVRAPKSGRAQKSSSKTIFYCTFLVNNTFPENIL